MPEVMQVFITPGGRMRRLGAGRRRNGGNVALPQSQASLPKTKRKLAFLTGRAIAGDWFVADGLERAKGFEPSTPTLPSSRRRLSGSISFYPIAR